ncbi:NAD(P)/FAD-dependent oxidoreductase [Halomonas organivorans]|uniref:D-amino-acid dehydrogenase n=1 Tax=Halomonas organivorans TaxID=257772 RepID=A0A7W5BZT4_9GAMM|nr:FAD-dependent oxidoreductase [Halomonas organivorans]MBB3142167.1 D-amino-acid dehydrogenase [Halomonas organivorans]
MPSEHRTAHASTVDADIVVVGAGIIGVACALSLSRQGQRVMVLDKQLPGMGASFGNAGHMATEQVFPIADTSILARLPGMLLDPTGPLRLDWRHFPKALPWFARLLWNLREAPYRRSVAGIRALNERSLAAWRQLLDAVNQPHLLRTDGSLLVYEREEASHEIEALQARMRDQRVLSEHWHSDAVRDIAPALSRGIRGGLFFPETGHVVDPQRVVEALVDAARESGVIFARDEAVSGRVDDRGVILDTRTRKLTASKVLVSCGAHSAPLTASLTGIKVPLDTERGYHLMLPNERERLPVAVTSLERRFIMTPMEHGLRLAGTVEFAGLTRPPNMQRAWQLHRLSHGLFETELDAGSASPWMGFRPSLPDSLPIIDSVMDDRVLLAFGHHHLGLTQAALTADIVKHLATSGDTRETVGGRSLPDLQPYRLSRFA